jgi:hypothetical protein
MKTATTTAQTITTFCSAILLALLTYWVTNAPDWTVNTVVLVLLGLGFASLTAGCALLFAHRESYGFTRKLRAPGRAS